ncbi:topoisomerase DNA-binding C4 zinc finger domain-containing protein [Desulfosporosinus metallidurans]|nr:topoisomerase DNA-binding C4 zinc finger domain-containing protein [Desulfosporosinus metallidurans]
MWWGADHEKGKYGDFKGCNNYPKCRFTITN